MKRNAAAALVFLLIPAAGLWLTCAVPDVDERFAARPGGELYVDLALGKGLSFDKGSLVVTSHAANEVRVVADTRGWGEYAVDVEAREVDGGVRVVGRVEGLLHWLFGGPTVDLRVFVPHDYRVDARIDGGPLVLEDLVGPIVARVAGSEGTTLERAEGDIHVILQAGSLHAEDITGRLEIETVDGDVHVAGVEGEVEVTTARGRIEIEDLDGPLLARSGRGRIEVEFVGAPAGNIETDRGEIEVEVPYSAGFQLDARTRSGGVHVDRQLALREQTPAPTIDDAPDEEDFAQLGQEIATQMTRHVKHAVSAYLEQGFHTGNWEWSSPDVRGAWRWDERSGRWEWDPASDAEDQIADVREGSEARPAPPASPPTWPLDGVGPGFAELEEGGDFFDREEDRGDERTLRHVVGPVNGGGGLLRLRTGRGHIHLRER